MPCGSNGMITKSIAGQRKPVRKLSIDGPGAFARTARTEAGAPSVKAGQEIVRGLVGRAMEMIGRAGTLRIKRHFFRPVARFFCRYEKKMYICRTIPLQDEYNIPSGRMPRAGRARWRNFYCLDRNGLKMRKMIRQRLSLIRTS